MPRGPVPSPESSFSLSVERPASAAAEGRDPPSIPSLFEYDPVLPHARPRRPSTPRIEPCPRDREEPAQPRHTERPVFLVDEREDVAFRAEVNRMSFLAARAPLAAEHAPALGPGIASSRPRTAS